MQTATDCRDLWELIERVGILQVRAAVVSSASGQWALLVTVPGRCVPAEVASEADYVKLLDSLRQSSPEVGSGAKPADSGSLVYVTGEVQPRLFDISTE
jgi:hypothetical protein